MSKEIAYLGLDVHKNSITLALLVEQRKEEEFIRKIPHDIKALLRTVKQLSEEYHLRTCYEASGCGFTIYRKFTQHGIDCIVVAPSLIPSDGKKVKTDSIDAKKLALYLRSGLLTAINVPNEDQERDRDLIRFRVFQVNALVRIKQSICAFLLRKGIETSISPLTKSFMNFIGMLELPHHDRLMLNRLISHYNYQNSLINELSTDIERLSRDERYKDRCDYLCAFKGISTISAMTILTHVPDFRAFPHPSKLMSYIGLTSMEYSSGESINKSGITKQGNYLLRKIMILAAQHYQKADRTGIHMIQKREGLPSSIVSLAQRADRRCRNKYYHLTSRGKHSNIAKTAVARELIGFIWEAMITYYQGEVCTPV